MRQRLANMGQETRKPNDLHALDERVRSYTHLASRNQYLVLIISLSWAALYQAITTNSGRFLLAVTVAISTSILSLFVCRLWLAGLKPMDERAKQLMLSSFTWTSSYVLMCTSAILLYLQLYVEPSAFLDRFEPLPFPYIYLSFFLSIATRNATLLVRHTAPSGTYSVFWYFIIGGVLLSFMELTGFIKLVELRNIPLVFIMFNPVVGLIVGIVLLVLVVTRHNRRKSRAEDE